MMTPPTTRTPPAALLLRAVAVAFWTLEHVSAASYQHYMAARLYVYTETAVRPDLLFTEPYNFYTSFPRNVRAFSVAGDQNDFVTVQGGPSGVVGWVGRTRRVFNSFEDQSDYSPPFDDFDGRKPFIIAAFGGIDLFNPASRDALLHGTPVAYNFTDDCTGGCEIHSGAQAAAFSVREQVYNQLTALLAQHPNDECYITGFSLGGVLATLAALDLKRRAGMTCQVYTTGTFPFGNQALADYVNAQLPDYFRVTTAHDPVPHIFFDPSFVHPAGEVYYANWLSPHYETSCTPAPACSEANFLGGASAPTTLNELVDRVAMPEHLRYLTEDGLLSWCASVVPTLYHYGLCRLGLSDKQAFHDIVASNGNWTILDRERVLAEGPVLLRDRRNQVLTANKCTSAEEFQIIDFLAEDLTTCSAKRTITRLADELAAAGRTEDGDALKRCLTKKGRVGPECVFFTVLGIPSLALNPTKPLGAFRRTLRVIEDVATCAAQLKEKFLALPVAKSQCQTAQTVVEILGYYQNPDEITCCSSPEETALTWKLRKALACLRTQLKNGTTLTTLKTGARCYANPSLSNPDCRIIIKKAEGQGLSTSTDPPFAGLCKCLSPARTNISSEATISPKCEHGWSRKAIDLYHGIADSCLSTGNSSDTEPIPYYVPITYGLAPITSLDLMGNLLLQCSGMSLTQALAMVNNQGAIAPAVLCALNPSANSLNCLSAIDGGLNSMMAANMDFSDGPNLCGCLAWTQLSFASGENALMGFGTPPTVDELRNECLDRVQAIADGIVSIFGTAIAALPPSDLSSTSGASLAVTSATSSELTRDSPLIQNITDKLTKLNIMGDFGLPSMNVTTTLQAFFDHHGYTVLQSRRKLMERHISHKRDGDLVRRVLMEEMRSATTSLSDDSIMTPADTANYVTFAAGIVIGAAVVMGISKCKRSPFH